MAETRAVLAPDGRMWKVGRQWLPFRVRLRRKRDPADWADPAWWANPLDFAEAGVGGVLVALALMVTGVVLLVIVWPVVALAIELIVLFFVLVAAIAGRLVLRKPWKVTARSKSPAPATLAWHVVGWRESGRVIDDVAAALTAGNDRPAPAGAELVEEP